MTTSNIDSKKAWELINSGVKLLDVRTASEYNDGHLPGAVNIPHDQLASKVNDLGLSLQEPVVLYCKSGGRSDFAMKVMHSMGYANAVNAGGYESLLSTK